MSDRFITDNVLVAFETMNHIKHKRTGKVEEMALKLDMSKAFNRVEWGCLEKIMYKMGFHDMWVKTVMRYVSSVTYSIKINGHPRGHIIPTRGIRQGDPLSRFLFLFCVEGLLALIRKATRSVQLNGVAACQRGPKISHIFFADDSIIFCRATIEECSTLEDILETYERSSSQQLNHEKTALFFSSNTPQTIQDTIKNRFGVEIIRKHETYLGLSSLVGKGKCNTFQKLKERLANKLSGWKEKLLSHAGKEILIKVVA